MTWLQALDPFDLDFKGRLGLREYLVFLDALSTAYVLWFLLSLTMWALFGFGVALVAVLGSHLLLVPHFLSVYVRRLHDINRSGAWMCVPFAIALAVVVVVTVASGYLLGALSIEFGPLRGLDLAYTALVLMVLVGVLGFWLCELIHVVIPAFGLPGQPGSNDYGLPPPVVNR